MIVDPLLKLVETQAAQALVILSGAPPVLERRGGKVALSMPSIDPDVVEMILEEVTTAEQRAGLASAAEIEVEYRSGDGRRHLVVIGRSGAQLRLAFRPAAAAVPPAAPPAPSAPGKPTPSAVVVPNTVAADSRPVAADSRPVAADSRAVAADSRAVAAPDGSIARALARAEHERASDVLVTGGLAVRIRVGGVLIELDEIVDDEQLRAFVEPLLDGPHRDELAQSGSTDLAVDLDDGGRTRRWRANLFRRHGGLSVALRPIRTEIPTLRELNLPDDFHELALHRSGLVLVTGMAGAGKSTTLVALVEHVNRTAAKHIITLEDPIEYEYQPARALVQQREIGRDVPDFATGLRAALRESPDIILLGEMRDRETISAALTAAETGHLVLGTLHAGSAAMAIDRVVDVFAEHQQSQIRAQLSTVLRAVVTQVLLPSTRPPARVPAYEKLLVTTAVGAKIRELRGHQILSEIQKGRAEGMVSLELAMARLVRAGRLAMDVAIAHAADRHLLAELVRQS